MSILKSITLNTVDESGNISALTFSCEGTGIVTNLTNTMSYKTLNGVYTELYSQMCASLKQSSCFSFSKIYKSNIQPYIGQKKLNELTKPVLSEWKAVINRKPYRLSTKRDVYKTLNQILNYAFRMDYIEGNNLMKLGNFTGTKGLEKENLKFYTVEQFEVFRVADYEYAIQHGNMKYYIFDLLLFTTGCRKGERNCLRWSDIKNENIVCINKSITQKLPGGEYQITNPKTKSSIREIEIPSYMSKLLKLHKIIEKQRCHGNGDKWSENNFIFQYEKPLSDSAIQNHMNTIVNKVNSRTDDESRMLPHLHPHMLRHTHRSLLVNSGEVSILSVSHRLGHSDPNMTLKTYSHYVPEEQDKAVELLEKLHG